MIYVFNSSLAPTHGCCINCKRRNNPPQPQPPAPPQTIGVSSAFHGRTLVQNACKTAVTAALEKYRDVIWAEDFANGNILPEFVLPDNIITTISHHSTTIKTKEDLLDLEPKWRLAKRYGEPGAKLITKVVEGVEERWAVQQRLLAEKQQEEARKKLEAKTKAQEEKAAEKREKQRLVDEAKKVRDEEKRREKELEQARKAEEKERKKQEDIQVAWDKYVLDLQMGVKQKGRPPKQPGT